MQYRFNNIANCCMCGFETSQHKVLGKRLNQSQGKHPQKKTGISTTICQCTNCGLIYSNPQPIPQNIQDHYGISPEDYWKTNEFMIEKDHFKTEIETLKTIMNIKPGMRFLDVGAGLGKTMTVFSRLDFDVYGFEPSKSFYQKAITQMKIPPDKLKLAMIEEVDYPENYFDFISFDAVLEHLYNPSEAIIKAMKWLKPGGIIFIDVPSSKWLVSKIIKFYYLMIGTDYVGNLSPMHPPFHLFEFSIDSFIKHSSQNNYEIAFYQYFVCETYMPKFLDFFIKPYMKWTNTGLQLCVWLRKK